MTEEDWIGRTFTRKTVMWRRLYESLNPRKFEIAKELYERYYRTFDYKRGGLTLAGVERMLAIMSAIDDGKYVEQKVVRVDGVVYSYDVKAYRKRNGGEN